MGYRGLAPPYEGRRLADRFHSTDYRLISLPVSLLGVGQVQFLASALSARLTLVGASANRASGQCGELGNRKRAGVTILARVLLFRRGVKRGLLWGCSCGRHCSGQG